MSYYSNYTASRRNEPSLYVSPAANVLGRVSTMLCDVGGHGTPTLQYKIGDWDGAVADTREGQDCLGTLFWPPLSNKCFNQYL